MKYQARLTEQSATSYEIEVLYRLPALKTPPHDAGRRLRALSRRPFGACDFATEAARLAPGGRAFVICGPGLPQHCHVTDESVDLAEVDEAVRLYSEAFA